MIYWSMHWNKWPTYSISANYDLILQHIQLSSLNLLLFNLEMTLSAFVAHRVNRLQTPRKLIEEIDSQPEPAPRCPSGRIKINVRLSNQAKPQQQTQTRLKNLAGVLPTPRVGTSPLIKSLNTSESGPGQGRSRLSYLTVLVVNIFFMANLFIGTKLHFANFKINIEIKKFKMAIIIL